MSRTLLSAAALCLLLSSLTAHAQDRSPRGDVSGTVRDSTLQSPIEYATVVLFGEADSSRIAGAVTDADGRFLLSPVPPGRYFAQVSFLGFLPITLRDLRFGPGPTGRDMGDVFLTATSLQGDEVLVEAERAQIAYRLDKKIINVSKMQTALSGTAVDVLENAPSITVDIEGNVSLRGSQNFTVLIDGRPSVLDANDALEQIPATAIETIEIITNPSAKYNPEGTSGIINIVMLKNRSAGVSGMINTNTGIKDKNGGDILLNRRLNGLTLTVGADYGRMKYPGTIRTEDRTIVDGNTYSVLSEGENKRGPVRYGARAEMEWAFAAKDLWTLGFRAGRFHGQHSSDISHDEWSDADNSHTLYSSRNVFDRTGDFVSAFTTLTHQFAPKGNELRIEGTYNDRSGEEKSVNELFDPNGTQSSGQKSTQSGPNGMLELKADYLRDLTAKRKVETGFQGRYGNFEDHSTFFEFDTLQNAYQYQPQSSHEVDYSQDIHAAYATYSDAAGPVSCMLGMRGEYMLRRIGYAEASEDYVVERWDYFPSAHFSVALGGVKQLMTSYSRWIQRSRRVDGWVLQPFLTWEDAYNVRRGNPSLEPEFIDSYELGYQTAVLGSFLSLEGYYRITSNRVEFLRSAYAENVTLHTVENVGKDYALGVESQLNMTMRKWWDMNLTGNIYDYRVKSEWLNGENTQKTFTWSSRLSNALKLSRSLRLQIDGSYSGPSVTSQGSTEEVFTVNSAIKYSFIENVLTATLQIRDVFASGARESTSSGADFYSYNYAEHDAPIVMLNVSCRFNNYKPNRDRTRDTDSSDDEDGI